MKLRIVIGIAVVVVLAVVAVALLSGGDDSDDSTSAKKNEPSKSADKKSSSDSDADSNADAGDEPALKTLDVNRADGKDAAVNVGALTRKPGKIYLRVSSAPKQKVTVNWTLACGVGATAQGDYVASPPETRELELPKKNPKTCVASASTQIDGNGRVKLAVMRDR